MNNIPYAVARSDRKSVAIVIDTEGSVLVRAPKSMPDAEISAFVNKKKMWIRAKQEQIAAISEKHEKLHADDGDFKNKIPKIYSLNSDASILPRRMSAALSKCDSN